MKVLIRTSFEKDAKKAPAKIQNALSSFIELVIKANQLSEIPQVKKMAGFKSAYRFRINEFRGGFYFENETIEFVRFLHRNEIYRKFP